MSLKDYLDKITKQFESPGKNNNISSTTNDDDFHTLRIPDSTPGRTTDYTLILTPDSIPGRIVHEHGRLNLEDSAHKKNLSVTIDSDDTN